MHALIITGGPSPFFNSTLPEAQLVIAADSGGDHARELGLKVDLIIVILILALRKQSSKLMKPENFQPIKT